MQASEYNLFSSINTDGVTVADTFNSWRKSTNGIIQKLTVEAGSPTWDSTGKVVIGAAVTNGNAATVDIGVARTGSGDAIINLGSVAAINNVVINRASGANGTFTVTNNGTGLFTLSQAGVADLRLLTSATERVRVLANGFFGIGTNNPDSLLHVNGGNFKVSGTITSGAITATTIGGTDITASGFLRSQTLGIGTNNTQFTVSSGGAITGASLGLSGNIVSGPIAVTSVACTGVISTSGPQIFNSNIILNENRINAGMSGAELALSYEKKDGTALTAYDTIIYNGMRGAAVTVTGSTKAVTFAGALSGITTLAASGAISGGAITGTSLISSGTMVATGTATAAEPTASTHLTTKSYVDARTNTVSKFPEKLNGGGYNSFDSFVFIDSNNVLRGIGQLGTRFGNTDIYAPASFFGSTDAGYSVSKCYINTDIVFVLTTAGEVYACAVNTSGQLGIGSTISKDSLTKVLTVTNCSKVAINADNDPTTTYFLTTDGKVYATGDNQYGQLGNGNTSNVSTPVLTLGPGNAISGNPITPVIDIENAGSWNGSSSPHTAIALLSDGTVWCVGYGGEGQMGNGAITAVNNKWVQVKTGLGVNLIGITKIFTGGEDSNTTMYALSSSGTLYGWGNNSRAQLATGATSRVVYARIIATDVANFWIFGAACFIKKSTDNRLYSWGYNGYGGLGQNSTSNVTSVTLVASLNGNVVENMWGSVDNTYQGIHIFLKLVGSNTIYASGHNSQGALGLGNTSNAVSTFTRVYFPITSPISDMICHYDNGIGGYTMILTADGNVYHTGISRWGIGQATNGNRTLFAKVTEIVCG